MARTEPRPARGAFQGGDRRTLIAGNWKMNLTHLEAIGLVQKLVFSVPEAVLDTVEAVVLPPFTALRSVQTLVTGDKLPVGFGAQDVSAHDSGAYTGEVSGAMLAALACQYVTVGHSERRALHGEDDALVSAKAQAALRHGLVPIVCVGEGLDVRRAGEPLSICTTQLDRSLDGLTAEQVAGTGAGGGIVVAYEPVWAIGTGEVATPEDAQEVCGELRTRLAQRFGPESAASVRILYGGSVKAGSTAGILAGPDIDGALVGGASLDADEFAQICRVAADGS
jgi:triosephosphate isomerase